MYDSRLLGCRQPGRARRGFQYRLGGLHTYSPRSVVLALTRGRCSDYWTSTESYEALQTYIDLDFDGLRQAVVALATGTRPQLARLIQNSDHLLQATVAGDAEQVAAALEIAPTAVTQRGMPNGLL